MQRLFKSKRFRLFLAIIAVFILGGIISVATRSNTNPISSAVGLILSPVQKLASFTAEKLGDFNISFRSSNSYLGEIDKLKSQIAEYEKELADYDGTKKKLESCEKVLELKEKNEDYKFSYATVIGRDSQDTYYSFIIDAGKTDGIEVNDPVVYGNYVVGLVYKVELTYSVVRTIINPKVNVSAYESKTRESGYISNDSQMAQDGLCCLTGLSRDTKIKDGGIVCTSGLGGIYPKGLIIGKVTEINENYDSTMKATVKPGIDYDSLEDVFVITDFEAQGISQVETE